MPGGFFDDGAAVHRLGIQDLPDAALFDDGVAVGAEAHAHENFLHVAQASHAAVDQVFALPGAIEAAPDDDFAGLQRDGEFFSAAFLEGLLAANGEIVGSGLRVCRAFGHGLRGGHLSHVFGRAGCVEDNCAVGGRVDRRGERFGGDFLRTFENFRDSLGQFRIHERQRDFGEAHRRALGGAVEDAVRHALGPQHLVALFAQHPSDGVHHVGLAAAVGADDARDPAAGEGDWRLLAEGFESQQFDFAEF